MLSSNQVYNSRQAFPTVPGEAIEHLIGKGVQDLQAPAVVIDRHIVERNCQLMLDAASKLGLAFRAHIKTHKTVQLAQLQMGEGSKDIRLIASTVAEIEHILPWLCDAKAEGKAINVLYGLPVSASAIPRLAAIANQLGSMSVSLLVDHPNQIIALGEQRTPAGPDPVQVFVKFDVGYHRAGVIIDSEQMSDLAKAVGTAQHIQLKGFYAHMGQSYAVSSSEEATDSLHSELDQLRAGAEAFLKCAKDNDLSLPTMDRLVLTIGASPTATATQNVLHDAKLLATFRQRLSDLQQAFEVEIHAGVYPLLDMQQLATRARPKALGSDSHAVLSFHSLGLRVLVEVSSIYRDRNGHEEALVAAGSICLGREPCKSYPGWGVVSPWPDKNAQTYDPEGDRSGWIIDRISQEHGVLRWHGSRERFWPLKYGQKLLVWPNHACMAGPNFSHYAIVDSGRPDPNLIVDAWARCRGW